MRHSLTKERYAALAAQIQRHEDALDIRAARRLKLLLEEEEIVHLPGETIYGWRTVIPLAVLTSTCILFMRRIYSQEG